MRHLHLQANQKGRDFVCGDLHGSYSCVQRFMKEVNFDESADRLICVGDLIDRGPQNEECLSLLFQPWFFSVYANHEEIMTDGLGECTGWGYAWVRNGGLWAQSYVHPAADATKEELELRDFVLEMAAMAANLPHIITVEKRDGTRFHVLHAELPKNVGISDDVIMDPQSAEKHLMKRSGSNGEMDLLWSRLMFGPLSGVEIHDFEIRKAVRTAELRNYHLMFTPRLSHIYSGHTIMQKPTRFYGQTNIDTKAYASYLPKESEFRRDWMGLTVTEPATDRFWFVNDDEFKEVEVVVIG